MNKRIQELAEESGLYHQLASGAPYPSAMTAEECNSSYNKFAELIVRECSEAVKNSIWHLPRGYKVADQAEFIKKHFGVE